MSECKEAEARGFERGVRAAMEIAMDDEPVEWECDHPLHKPLASTDVPDGWLCDRCGSGWWDIHLGVASMPPEYQTAARILSLLPGAADEKARAALSPAAPQEGE